MFFLHLLKQVSDSDKIGRYSEFGPETALRRSDLRHFRQIVCEHAAAFGQQAANAENAGHQSVSATVIVTALKAHRANSNVG